MKLFKIFRNFERVTGQFIKQSQQLASQLPGIRCGINPGRTAQGIGQYQFPGRLAQDGFRYSAQA